MRTSNVREKNMHVKYDTRKFRTCNFISLGNICRRDTKPTQKLEKANSKKETEGYTFGFLRGFDGGLRGISPWRDLRGLGGRT